MNLGLVMRLTANGAQAISELGKVSSAAQAAAASMTQGLGPKFSAALSGSFTVLKTAGVAAAATIAAGFASLGGVISGISGYIAHTGIAFNSVMEQGKLGIASLVASQSVIADATGRVVTGQEALSAAIKVSESQMTKLRIAGLETAATTEQLVDAYQQAVGAGLAAGLNLDQIRETTVGIVQAAGALGVPMHQVSQEVRAILEGSIDINARVAKSLGITGEMVKNWREQGTLAEELSKRLEVFRTSGAEVAKTWVAIKSNMEEAISTLAGEATAGMFEQLKTGASNAMTGIFDLTAATVSDRMKGITETLSDILTKVGSGIGGAMEFAVEMVMQISEWLSENKAIVTDIFDQTVALGKQLWALIEPIVGAAIGLGKWLVEIGFFNVALRGAQLFVAGLRDGFSLIGAALVKVGAAIIDFVQKPFADVLGTVGKVANWIKAGWGDSLVGLSNSINTATAGMHDYADAVFDRFASGKTAVADLRAEWAKGNNEVVTGTKKATDSTFTLTKAKTEDTKKTKEQEKAEKERIKTLKELEKWQNKVAEEAIEASEAEIKANYEAIKALREKAEGYEAEAAMIGMTNDEREKAVALMELEKQAALMTAEAYAEMKKRVLDALDAKQQKQRAHDAAEEVKAEYKELSDSIEKTFHDGFLNMLEDGKDSWRSFTESLANTFKSIVVDEIYKSFLKKPITAFAQVVAGGMGSMFTGSASAAGGAGDMLGGLGSMFGGAGGMMGGLAGDVMGLAGNMFSAEGIGVIAGGVAETLGASSAFAGSIGAGVATAIPWVAGIVAVVGLIDKFSKGGTPHLGNSYSFDQTGKADQITFDEYQAAGGGDSGAYAGKPGWLYGVDGPSPYDDAIQAAGTSLMDRITTMTEALGGTLAEGFSFNLGFAAENEAETGSGGAAQVMVGGETVLDIYKRYAKDGQTGIQEFLEEVGPKIELVAYQTAEGLNPVIDAIADSVDVSTDSLETINSALAMIGELGAGLAVLQEYGSADPFAAVADANKGAMQTWQEQGTAMRDLLAVYDGSVAATNELAALTQSRYQIELQLAAQITSALESTHAMFSSTIEEMKFSTLDQAGQYDYLREKSIALEEALRASTDPEEIEQLSKEIDAVSKQAWQLLGEEERKIKLAEYEQYLNEMDALTTERLNAAGALITNEHDASLPDSIATAIDDAMARAAASITAAAQAMQVAADTPVKVEVDNNITVDVNVDAPATAEVGIG